MVVVRACGRAGGRGRVQGRVPLQWLMPCFLLVAWVAVGVAYYTPRLPVMMSVSMERRLVVVVLEGKVDQDLWSCVGMWLRFFPRC